MINLLYCGNDKVFDGVLTSALSAVMRMEKKEALRVYIFTMDITRMNPKYTPMLDKHAKAIENALVKYNEDTEVKLIDVTDLYEKELAHNANEGCYCSPYTLLRLLADLVELPDKILYLDADIMFNRSVSLLYDICIDDYEFACARDHYGKYLIKPNYMNAGVILFNMKRCRETKLFEKARELIRVKKLVFADQSALIRSVEKKKMLKQRFNDQKYLHKHTVIRHFSKRLFYLPYPHTENIKQWQIDKVRDKFKYDCFDDIYDEYLKVKSEIQF